MYTRKRIRNQQRYDESQKVKPCTPKGRRGTRPIVVILPS